MIYLDHHATTPVDPDVLAAMQPWWTERIGNPSNSHHSAGRAAREALEHARAQVAALVNAEPREVVFTSGATEANNWVLHGLFATAKPGEELLVSAVEHKSLLVPAEQLRRRGVIVKILPVDAVGRITAETVATAITPASRLVCVMAANNEVGTVNPVEEIAAVCRERRVWGHCDAAQAAGKLPGRVWPADLLSLTAHKLYGPPGVGALVIRRGARPLPLTPLLLGGSQERRLRAGTLPTPLIVGFGKACELALQRQTADAERIQELRERLWTRLSRELQGLALQGCPSDRLPGNLHVSFAGIDAEALLARIGNEIAASAGAACSVDDHAPSHVLQAMHIPADRAKGSVRFGLGRFNTADEIDQAAQLVIAAVRELRTK
ncbi:MAG TPA: cysteine desulfurase family protein [Planctomycetaceae bacterium]|nr:cysteine desulfurase family protein [Planctomycetaceae bacterium]